MKYLRYSWEFIRTFRFKHFKRFRSMTRPPVLVVGCGRSGTSLLLSILGAHPSIHACQKETGIFLHPPKFPFKKWDLNWRLMKFYVFFLSKEEIRPGALRWCEKTPRHIRCLERIFSLLEGKVKVVHIVRDGRDVVNSVHPGEDGPHVPPERWVNDLSKALEFEGHPDLYTLRYEDLVSSPRNTIVPLMECLGEGFVEEQSEFYRTSSVVEHRAFEQGAPQPIHADSIGKWKGDPVKEERAEWLEKDPKGRELLEHYGYL